MSDPQQPLFAGLKVIDAASWIAGNLPFSWNAIDHCSVPAILPTARKGARSLPVSCSGTRINQAKNISNIFLYLDRLTLTVPRRV